MSSMAGKALSAPIRALLEPTITAPLFIAILYYPKKLQSILPVAFRPWIYSRALPKTLAAFLALSLLRALSNKLSSLVVNNFKNVKFIPREELVVVTGGSSGIGALMAKTFAENGAKVVVFDISAPKSALPPNIFYFQTDVTSPEKIAISAAAVRKEHGDPTVIINNAGIGSCLSILDGSDKSIQKTFEVNTISHFWMAREFVPSMVKKNHGHVVTIASMAAYVVLSMNVDYSCTKASANAFHEGLSSELRNKYNAPKVRTTLVNPSWIKTPLTEPLDTPEWKGGWLAPEEVADSVVKQVMSGESGHLILPKKLGYLSAIRGWPSWLQYGARNGAAHTLEVLNSTYNDNDKLEHFNRDPQN